MTRRPGLSVRVKLTLSYAGFLVVVGVLLLAVVWLFLLRYVPDEAVPVRRGFVPTRSDLVEAFAPRVALMFAALLVVGLVGGWFLAGRMLAPLTRITAATRHAATGSLSHRIALEGPRDEFRELADSFDSMLARIEAHVAEQRRFAANASHELRTPLSIERTMLEVARDDPDRDVDALLERLGTVNRRAIDLTEALLLLSRTEQRSFTREHVDLSLIAEEAAETLLPLAEQHGVSVDVSGDAAAVTGSRTLLLQLTTNLMHNAIVHNHAGGQVWVRTSQVQGGPVLVAENSGDVLDPRIVTTLTEPFRRGTDRISGGGAGLGLAIAGSIVTAHDGVLTLAARPNGGLRVTVELPAGS